MEREKRGLRRPAAVAAAPVQAAVVVDTVGAGNTFQAALLCALGEARALDAAALPAARLEQALRTAELR
jgi:fructokinase